MIIQYIVPIVTFSFSIFLFSWLNRKMNAKISMVERKLTENWKLIRSNYFTLFGGIASLIVFVMILIQAIINQSYLLQSWFQINLMTVIQMSFYLTGVLLLMVYTFSRVYLTSESLTKISLIGMKHVLWEEIHTVQYHPSLLYFIIKTQNKRIRIHFYARDVKQLLLFFYLYLEHEQYAELLEKNNILFEQFNEVVNDYNKQI